MVNRTIASCLTISLHYLLFPVVPKEILAGGGGGGGFVRDLAACKARIFASLSALAVSNSFRSRSASAA